MHVRFVQSNPVERDLHQTVLRIEHGFCGDGLPVKG